MTKDLDRRNFMKAVGLGAASAVLANQKMVQAQTTVADSAKGGDSMVNVAMLSKWHSHAEGYGKTLKNMDNVKITAVWDDDIARGEAWAKELEAPFIKDLDALLAKSDVDAVCVNASTNRHAEIMTAAANAHKHIFTEKVMGLTVKECNQIAKAVKAANVKFTISFPYRTRPEVLYAKQAVDEGLLGRVTSFRVRVAHDGVSGGWMPPHFLDPKVAGGGAMMDLGAHPMYLGRWICGQPKRISSTFLYTMGLQVEDNAVSTVEFENGIIGVMETSLISKDYPFSMEITGTEGTLYLGDQVERRLKIKSTKLENKEWQSPKLPKALPTALQMWMNGIRNNDPIPFDTEAGTQLTELMEYAYQAHHKKRQVEIPARKVI